MPSAPAASQSTGQSVPGARAALLVLGYTGRHSGRQYAIPVMYARSGADLVAVAGQHTTKSWWRNFGPDPQSVRVLAAVSLAENVRVEPGQMLRLPFTLPCRSGCLLRR